MWTGLSTHVADLPQQSRALDLQILQFCRMDFAVACGLSLARFGAKSSHAKQVQSGLHWHRRQPSPPFATALATLLDCPCQTAICDAFDAAVSKRVSPQVKSFAPALSPAANQGTCFGMRVCGVQKQSKRRHSHARSGLRRPRRSWKNFVHKLEAHGEEQARMDCSLRPASASPGKTRDIQSRASLRDNARRSFWK